MAMSIKPIPVKMVNQKRESTSFLLTFSDCSMACSTPSPLRASKMTAIDQARVASPISSLVRNFRSMSMLRASSPWAKMLARPIHLTPCLMLFLGSTLVDISFESRW